MRITATVLSHNSRKTLLEVIGALKVQTLPPDRIVVVDNASTDGTRKSLADLDQLDVIRLTSNSGVGSGHNRAVGAALAEGSCTHVWLLEHDSIPTPTCLEELVAAERDLAAAGRTIGALVPRRTRRDEPDMYLSRGIEPHDRVIFTFNGALIPRSTFEEVGQFRVDFFVGAEDHEYSDRVQASGREILMVPRSLLFHETVGRRRRGESQSVFRTYYSIRNSLYLNFRLRRRLTTGPLSVFKAIAGSVRTVVFEDQKATRVAARVVATVDGLSGRLGPRDYWFLS